MARPIAAARAAIALVVVAAIVAACVASPTGTPPSIAPGGSPSGTAAATASDVPTEPPTEGPTPTTSPDGTTPSPEPSDPPEATACSGSDANRIFFGQAAASMAWTVYCAVLPDGWFLEAGSYRLADGGHLEVTYRGPGDAHVALVEGNVCSGAEVEACAPRDAVIGPAAFGDREGELGRLVNGLVVDVDRGSTPSWRATGLGLAEDAFRGIAADFLPVGD
jgi:hypothetical protein